MILNIRNGSKQLSPHSNEMVYWISLKLETTNSDIYLRLVNAIKDAVPEPKETEQKPNALGFQLKESEPES